jgi:DNA-binding SARP family transcriptional activator/Tfp pilus assembly protein PilF
VENVSRLALFLLGPPRVERDGEPVHIPRRKAVALLAYLAMTGESHSRDTLAALLWSEQDQDGARAGLRRVLTSLRKTLGATRLDADRETVCLDRDAEFWLDVTEFQGRLAECRTHDHAPEAVCPACVSLLAEAVDLYHDDFLAGFTLRDSPAFDDWQFFQTQDLRDQLAGALERLAHWHDSQKQVEPAIPYARRWLALDPLHEPAHRCLMRLYAGSGQQAAALRQYAQCERVLREELGVSPEEETVQLCQIIKEKRELPPAEGHISTTSLAAEPSSFSHVLGALLGDRYRLDAEIGRGGVGTVYRAYDTLLERGVAVKVLSAATLSAESRTRLLREAQAAAKLNHPNVVSVYDAGKARGVPFIVMELVEGDSLHERRLQTLEETLSVAQQVCTALEHAHAHSIIHRDLKPENVMIAPDDTAKLMDFGLARSGTSRITVEGAIVGTVSYLSPEQAVGGEIDHRADLYSLGVMLYELTTGQLPFAGDDVLAVISQHLHAPVVPPSTHSPTIPPELDALIVRLLSKRPEDRPSSAAEVRQALESLSRPKEPARQVEEGELDISPPAPGLRPDTPAQLPAFLGEGGREEGPERPVFVAREPELARLDDFLEMALAGQGQVAFVTGGAGRGKTALIQAFARRALDAHPRMLVATGGCNPYSGVGDPYLPFREMLGMLTGDVEGCWAAGVIDTDHARRLWAAVPQAIQALIAHGGFLLDIFVPSRALLSRATTAAPAGAAWLPELKRLIERSESRPPDLAQHHLFDQYADVLRDLSAHHPLVLLLDDLQWVDTASSGLLYHLGRRLEGSHVLIVCAYRPDEVALGRPSAVSGEIERHPLEKALAEFKRTFGDVWIDLAQVDRARGRQFIASFLETEPNRLGDEFRNRLFQHTEGHALFTVELLRAMQDRGDLVQDGDGYWIEGTTLDWEALPTRVEAVIEERIERLEDELREILTVASVEGEDFTAQVVARVQEIGERKLLRALSRELERRHRLVREQGEVRVGRHSLSRYRFAHALFQQYLYNGLSEGERRLLHRAMAEVLEELYEGHTGEINAPLAYHWEQAGEPGKAAKYLLRLGETLLYVAADTDAIDLFERALAMLPKESVADRTEAVILLGWAHFNQGDFHTAMPHFEEGPAVSSKAGFLARESEALQGLARIASYQGEHEEAERYLERAIELARQVDDRKVLPFALVNMGQIALAQEDGKKAERFVRDGLAIFKEMGDGQERWIGWAHRILASVAYLRRDYGELERYLEEALAKYKEVGARVNIADCLNVLGEGARQQGKYEDALRYYKEALAVFQELGMSTPGVLNNLGHAYIGLGEDDVAWGYLCQALKESLAIMRGPLALEGLVGVAWLRTKARQHEPAAELLGLVLSHPALTEEVRWYAEPVLSMVRESLPTDELEAALARGRSFDLEQVVTEILVELEG